MFDNKRSFFLVFFLCYVVAVLAIDPIRANYFANQNKLSNQDIVNNFNHNRYEFDTVAEFCKANDNVQHINLKRQEITYKYNNTVLNEDAIENILHTLSLIQAKSLRCVRWWGLPNSPLAFVLINFESQGLGVSGSLKGVKYFVAKESLKEFLEAYGGNEKNEELAENWYIYSSS